MILPSLAATALRPGESFESWLRRFSVLRDESIPRMLSLLGADVFQGPGCSAWLWQLTDSASSRLASFGRVDVDQLRAVEFARTAIGIVPPASSATEANIRGWISLGTMRFCPLCVAAESGFLWRWQLGCSVVCVEHRRLLRLGCECGFVRWSSFTRPPRGVLPVDVCPSCGVELATLDTASAPVAVIDAQRIVDAAIDDSECVLFGSRVDREVWFLALTCAAALASIVFGAGKARLIMKPSVISLDPRRSAEVLVEAEAGLVSEDAFRDLAVRAIESHRRRTSSRITLGPDVLSPELADLWREVELSMRPAQGKPYGRNG